MALTPLHACGLLVCTLSDLIFLPKYINDRSFLRKYYGSFRFRAHIYGMTLFLILGGGAVLSALTGHSSAVILARLMGCALFAVSLPTFALCLRTYGTRNITGPGYAVYTSLLACAGARAVADPTEPARVVEAWLLVHAYAGTRAFVLVLWALRKAGGGEWKMALSHKGAYDLAVLLASTVMLRVTYDVRAVLAFYAVWWAAQAGWIRLQTRGGKLMEDDVHTMKLLYNDKYIMPQS